jgi:hypothetical protein
MIGKPYSQACENNKDPILNVIREVFSKPVTVWEIGSGTGQHACHFARHLPHLVNLKTPLILDVTDDTWPCEAIDALFTANTLHIMSRQEVEIFFARTVNR